jgi:hypothetical protein
VGDTFGLRVGVIVIGPWQTSQNFTFSTGEIKISSSREVVMS